MELDLTWRKHLWSLEKKTLESPLHSKKIKPVNLKGNQPWIFIGMTDAEAPILWPPDAKNQYIGKNPDAWKDWRQNKKGASEDEMVGWHHWLSGHEFEQTSGDSEGQGSLVCCSPWSWTWLNDWPTGTCWNSVDTWAEVPSFYKKILLVVIWEILSL